MAVAGVIVVASGGAWQRRIQWLQRNDRRRLTPRPRWPSLGVSRDQRGVVSGVAILGGGNVVTAVLWL